MSKWLHWQPHDSHVGGDSPDTAPPKLPELPPAPSKPSFGSFGSPRSRGNPIIKPPDKPEPVDVIIEKSAITEPTKPTKLPACPYDLPAGVRLLNYAQKNSPVDLTVWSVVNDVPKFIRHALAELDARLHHPAQIKAGDSVFELLSKLADSGLELRLEWPPASQIICQAPGTEPSKPIKLPVPPESNARGADITDEDLPF